jgi:putative Mg2+ transporter-C (MgtC) family protein
LRAAGHASEAALETTGVGLHVAAARIWSLVDRADGELIIMTDLAAYLASFDVLPHAIALAVAYLLALPIGWNREREERSAGLRTFPLVAVATCGFIQAAERIALGEAEPMARIIEGLITGMGFIGGGAILRRADSVKGTATAASLWITGAIGVAAGVEAYDVAVMLSLTTVLTLLLLSPLKRLTDAGERGQMEEDG